MVTGVKTFVFAAVLSSSFNLMSATASTATAGLSSLELDTSDMSPEEEAAYLEQQAEATAQAAEETRKQVGTPDSDYCMGHQGNQNTGTNSRQLPQHRPLSKPENRQEQQAVATAQATKETRKQVRTAGSGHNIDY